ARPWRRTAAAVRHRGVAVSGRCLARRRGGWPTTLESSAGRRPGPRAAVGCQEVGQPEASLLWTFDVPNYSRDCAKKRRKGHVTVSTGALTRARGDGSGAAAARYPSPRRRAAWSVLRRGSRWGPKVRPPGSRRFLLPAA